MEAFRRSNRNNRVHVCRDGEEALDFLLQRGRFSRPGSAPRPDLVLLDLNLPRRSGFEILDLVRRHEVLRQTPIIILTTSDRDEDISRSYRTGANSYLTKPVQFEDCIELVNDIQHYWLETSRLPSH